MCTDEFNPKIKSIDGKIEVPKIGKCLVAEAALPNANFMFGECIENAYWDLTPFGYIQLANTSMAPMKCGTRSRRIRL